MRVSRASALLAVSLAGAACDGDFRYESPLASAGYGGVPSVAGTGGAARGGATTVGGYGGSGGSLGSGGAFSGWQGLLAACDRCFYADLVCAVSEESLACGECINDATCARRSSALHTCVGEWPRTRCVGCDYDGDCPSSEDCVSDAHMCIKRCDDDSDCAGLSPTADCNDERGYCRVCRTDQDCSTLSTVTPYCLPSGVACVGCRSEEQCVGSPLGKYCDPALWRCVACRDSSDCGAGLVCDADRHVCVGD
ncbi:MAG: hypothetical protein QM756_20730 [Polyangiaceae bacterium]